MSAGNVIVLSVAVAVLGGCGPCRNTPSRILAESDDWQTFGTPLTAGFGTSLDLMVKGMVAKGTTVLVRDAIVVSVSEDGSSMILKSEPRLLMEIDRSARVLVRFGNFTVPMDCEGRAAVICGVISRNTTGDREELTIEATGVRVSS
jgi:hypothetical protein